VSQPRTFILVNRSAYFVSRDIERISYERLRPRISARLPVLSPESVEIFSADGRYLAAAVRAAKSVPPYDVSEKDGFAVSSRALAEATSDNPITLRVTDTVSPGRISRKQLGSGECMKILTGAYLPPGADAVVMQEDVEFVRGRATFTKSINVGANLFRAGSDIKKGEVLFDKGHRLSFEDTYILDSAGISDVPVTQRVKVGVLATGDELTGERSKTRDGFILDINRPVIMSHLERCGFLATDAGLARDDIDDISGHIERVLSKVDALITTGGSSVSNVDLVSESLSSMNTKRVFHGVKMRPSSTAGLSLHGSKPIFILSGLIQSCLVALYSFVIPSLRFMAGLGYTFHSAIEAKIEDDFKLWGEPGFKRAVWVHIENRNGVLYAIPSPASSHSRSVLRTSHGFFIGNSGSIITKGSTIQIIQVRDLNQQQNIKRVNTR